MFVDKATIYVQGGDGGDGCMAFRREFKVPKGGPNGGNGGRGGSVIIVAEANVDSLAILVGHKHWRAKSGHNGQGGLKDGKEGEDVVIPVPPGTIVRDAERGHVLKDLAKVGDQLVAAHGGRGGHGNTFFKSSINRAPRQCESGIPGEARKITLELKIIADVGLIGKPNAGKSTLLSRISRAHPEIADYPFTTRYPNLGIVSAGADRQFVVADIPGLIEGAHAGVGLGHEFLRHVERTKLLVHLVEPLPADESDPFQNYLQIREELKLYDPGLVERPEILVVTKAELPGAAELAERFRTELNRPALLLSAVTGKGLPVLIAQIQQTLTEQEGTAESPLVGVRPASQATE